MEACITTVDIITGRNLHKPLPRQAAPYRQAGLKKKLNFVVNSSYGTQRMFDKHVKYVYTSLNTCTANEYLMNYV